MHYLLLFASVFFAFACGKSDDKPVPQTQGNPPETSDEVVAAEDEPADEESNVEDDANVVIKGVWELKISGDRNRRFLLDAGQNTPITGTVAAAVTFVVVTANFITGSGTGVTSYGTLDVTQLRDNSLRVCGVNNNSRCVTALIRVYTVGTPSAGLWSAVEGVGLPILTGASSIGLDVAGAINTTTYTIPANLSTLKLSNISATAIKIPIAVDFTDAAAGTYTSTMRVEYALK